MKHLMVAILAAAFVLGASMARAEQPTNAKQLKQQQARQALVDALGNIPKSCRFKGKKMWGKVQVVKSFPDFKVQVVSSFPDLKVQKVSSFPDKCGKWKFVTSFPDFKIQFVKSFPDFKIKYVTSFPGVN